MTTLLGLYDLAEQEGIEVDYFPMKEVVAASFPQGWIAMDVDKMENSTEEKIHLAHEMGHCMTGSFYNIYSRFDVRGKHEYRADKWAIKKLIPEDELMDAVHCGFVEVWELADFFNVPCPFMEKAMLYYQQQHLLMG